MLQYKNVVLIYYGKCPKISNTKVSNKMAYANSADPEGAVWSGSTLFARPLCILNIQVHKKQTLDKTCMK